MGELIAPFTRRRAMAAKDALVLEFDAEGDGFWHVSRRHDGTVTHIATYTRDAADAGLRDAVAARRRGETVVLTPPRPFLLRHATLPLAAAANLDQVLRYEMDRLTPFAAEDVCFSHRVLARRPETQRIEVELALVPLAWVRDALRRLASLSIRPRYIEEAGASARRISLEVPRHTRAARFAWRTAQFACGALAVAVIGLPLLRQSLALAAVDDDLARLRPGMAQVDALRRQIAASSAGAGRVAAAHARGATALRVLGILTDLLPDDTWLTGIALHREHVTIDGHSAAATRLIAAMAGEPELKNPAFAAPVVRADDGSDAFTIQAGFGS